MAHCTKRWPALQKPPILAARRVGQCTIQWPARRQKPHSHRIVPTGRPSVPHGQVRRADHHQEVRQPAALQHRHQHLCDARRPRHHGEGRRGFRGLRRQDQRGHHPLGADADHLRAGKQGRRPEPPADQLPAPADPLLRRQHADDGAALSRSVDRLADQRADQVPRADFDRRSAWAASARSRSRCAGTWRCSSAPSRCLRRSRARAAAARRRRRRTRPASRPRRRRGGDIDDLKRQIDEMQKRIDRIGDKDK